ncbi:MAG: heavy-metal-associated domain-containing protein [Gemmatimonadaceae bacterium]|nr:heavy-metal-associated domain-containing protein [Gemmatimonadaceae bacterium]
MTCGHCIGAVRDALEGLPGVEVDQVRIGRASVSFEPGAVSPAAVIEAIRDAGYQASFASDTGSAVGVQQKASLPQASTGGSCCSSH